MKLFTTLEQSVLALLVVIMCSQPIFAADPLIEFFMWNEIGKVVGRGVEGFNKWNQLRTERLSTIKGLEAKLAQCRNCAERARLESELRKWKRRDMIINESARAIIGRYQTPAGAKAWGNLLGIQMDWTAGTRSSRGPEIPRHQFAMPESVKKLPQQCQDLYMRYVDCGYDNNSPTPFGVCKDHYKLFSLCSKGDMERVAKLQDIQQLRKLGLAIPEIKSSERSLAVYYGDVPDEFVPRMPPPDAVLAKKRNFQVQMRKKRAGALYNVHVFFFRMPPRVSLSDFKQKARAILWDDIRGLRNERVIECRYMRSSTKMFWYASLPTGAEPERLRQRWEKTGLKIQHPVLRVGNPVTQCPATSVAAR